MLIRKMISKKISLCVWQILTFSCLRTAEDERFFLELVAAMQGTILILTPSSHHLQVISCRLRVGPLHYFALPDCHQIECFFHQKKRKKRSGGSQHHMLWAEI